MIASKFSGYPFPRLSFQHRPQIEINYYHSQLTFRLIGRIVYVKVKGSVEEMNCLNIYPFQVPSANSPASPRRSV